MLYVRYSGMACSITKMQKVYSVVVKKNDKAILTTDGMRFVENESKLDDGVMLLSSNNPIFFCHSIDGEIKFYRWFDNEKAMLIYARIHYPLIPLKKDSHKNGEISHEGTRQIEDTDKIETIEVMNALLLIAKTMESARERLHDKRPIAERNATRAGGVSMLLYGAGSTVTRSSPAAIDDKHDRRGKKKRIAEIDRQLESIVNAEEHKGIMDTYPKGCTMSRIDYLRQQLLEIRDNTEVDGPPIMDDE